MKQAQVSIIYYILFLLLLVTMTLAISTTGDSPRSEDKYIEITITSGDTLWDINESFKGQHNLSFSEFVSWIERENNIQHDRLKPGEKLYVPIEMKGDFQHANTYASSNGY